MTTKNVKPAIVASKATQKTGRIRLSDDSMKGAGVRKSDVVLVRLGGRPKDGGLCAAFTAGGELMIRHFRQRSNRDIVLTTGRKGEVPQVFAPRAVVILGPVLGVERGGAR